MVMPVTMELLELLEVLERREERVLRGTLDRQANPVPARKELKDPQDQMVPQGRWDRRVRQEPKDRQVHPVLMAPRAPLVIKVLKARREVQELRVLPVHKVRLDQMDQQETQDSTARKVQRETRVVKEAPVIKDRKDHQEPAARKVLRV